MSSFAPTPCVSSEHAEPEHASKSSERVPIATRSKEAPCRSHFDGGCSRHTIAHVHDHPHRQTCMPYDLTSESLWRGIRRTEFLVTACGGGVCHRQSKDQAWKRDQEQKRKWCKHSWNCAREEAQKYRHHNDSDLCECQAFVALTHHATVCIHFDPFLSLLHEFSYWAQAHEASLGVFPHVCFLLYVAPQLFCFKNNMLEGPPGSHSSLIDSRVLMPHSSYRKTHALDSECLNWLKSKL